MAKKLTEAELKRRARKKKIRKRRFFIFCLLLILIGVGVFYYFLQTKLFPVKKVAASGSKLYSAVDIIKESGINDKTPLMSVREDEITARIKSKLPYIESVKIKRTLPDAVKITVTDAKEAFAFKNGSSYALVSEKLQVLTASKTLKKGLIAVTLKGARYKIGKAVEFPGTEEKELFDLIYSYSLKKGIKLDGMDISNTSRITVYTSGLYEVNLGNNVNIKEKLDQLAAMIKEIGGRKGTINLQMWTKTDSKGTFIPEK